MAQGLFTNVQAHALLTDRLQHHVDAPEDQHRGDEVPREDADPGEAEDVVQDHHGREDPEDDVLRDHYFLPLTSEEKAPGRLAVSDGERAVMRFSCGP